MFVAKYIDDEKIKNNPNLLINLVFAFFPISFILGSLFININLVLFCCLGIFNLKSKVLKAKFDFTLKIIFLFFLIILFSTSLSFIKSLYFEGYEYIHLIRLTKSILFFRFFLMLIIVYLLNEFNILNFKYFFLSAALFPILISLDIIYQYVFGFNIVGLKREGTMHNSGFFDDELIAGSFVQRFSFFSILFTALVLKNKYNVKYILIPIIISILGLGILFSGNRMPFILFIFGLFLFFLFDMKVKKIITVGLIGLFILFKFFTSSNEVIRNYYESFLGFPKTILMIVLKDVAKKNSEEAYEMEGKPTIANTVNISGFQQRIFLTAIETWKQNKIFGNGIKSFRIDCGKSAVVDFSSSQKLKDRKVKGISTMWPPDSPDINLSEDFDPLKKNLLCSGHPHNYYLEILTETGIVGLFFTSILALLFVVFIFKNFKFLKGKNLGDFILFAAVISLILDLFPFKSSGSLFTTNNATYLILISSIILGYKKLLKIKNSR